MPTIITWNISVLNCIPQTAEGADYVVTAHWQCNGVDGDYNGSVYSTCSFPVVQGEFTPYNQLTKDQVLAAGFPPVGCSSRHKYIQIKWLQQKTHRKNTAHRMQRTSA